MIFIIIKVLVAIVFVFMLALVYDGCTRKDKEDKLLLPEKLRKYGLGVFSAYGILNFVIGVIVMLIRLKM